MKWKITNLQTSLYLITAIILLVGLGSAILIYLTAENDSDSGLVYDDPRCINMIWNSTVERLMCLRVNSVIGLSGYGKGNHSHSQ